MELRRLFHAAEAAAFTPSKSAGAPKLLGSFSRVRLSRALATLTKEMPIFTCTTRLVRVSKLTQAPVAWPVPEAQTLGLTVAPFQTPPPVQERSNFMAKNTR